MPITHADGHITRFQAILGFLKEDTVHTHAFPSKLASAAGMMEITKIFLKELEVNEAFSRSKTKSAQELDKQTPR